MAPNNNNKKKNPVNHVPYIFSLFLVILFAELKIERNSINEGKKRKKEKNLIYHQKPRTNAVFLWIWC